jgi:hypothetical protein
VGEAFGEKVLQRLVCARRRLRIVDRPKVGIVGLRICKRVHNPAIGVDLPIRFRREGRLACHGYDDPIGSP